MKNYTVKRYETQDYNHWNAFINDAKNATFLFHRDFMEYHSDRFQDYSLIVLENNKWIAVLPANRVGEEVFSHQGLTYGGVVFNEKIKLAEAIPVFRTILSFLHQNAIMKLHLKLIPSIYHDKPADEINYALFLAEAKLERRDSLSVLDLKKDINFSKERKQTIRRGIKNGLTVKEEVNFKPFWDELLIPNLSQRYQAKPVHSLDEIEKLQKLFPDNIRQFNVYYQDRIVVGTTIFVSKHVAHPQYISGNEQKNELGSIDFLYHYLITEIFKDKKFFDFGPSHEEDGKKIKEGILFWKESFGTGTITQDFYEVNTANLVKLENILI